MRLLLKPPCTPPSLSLLFFFASALFPLADVALALLGHSWDSTMTRPRNWDTNADLVQTVLVGFAQAAIPSTLLYLLGTLPLRVEMPAPNVAKQGDVRLPQSPSMYITNDPRFVRSIRAFGRM